MPSWSIKPSKVQISLEVTNGKGYQLADQNKSDSDPISTIAIDSSFTPVEKVNYYVENTRVGEATDYDKLIIEVWTNGTISPQEALSEGSNIIINDFKYFRDLPNVSFVEEEVKEEQAEEVVEDNTDQQLEKTIEEMDLSLRSFNCLKRAGFDTVSDIVEKSEAELKTIKNFGKKSLEEVKDKVHEMGLSLKDE